MRRARLLLGALAATTVLAGCSSDGSDGSDGPAGSAGSAPSDHASPDGSDIAGVAWSPCDELTARSVSRLVGAGVEEHDGTAAAPRCTFTPTREGGAAYDLSYLWFDGGLDAALAAMGASGAQLKPAEVPGADAARLAVRATKSAVLVTGFVQTPGLVQSVNAAQLAPYDEQQVVDATRALLAELAKRAPDPSSG